MLKTLLDMMRKSNVYTESLKLLEAAHLLQPVLELLPNMLALVKHLHQLLVKVQATCLEASWPARVVKVLVCLRSRHTTNSKDLRHIKCHNLHRDCSKGPLLSSLEVAMAKHRRPMAMVFSLRNLQPPQVLVSRA